MWCILDQNFFEIRRNRFKNQGQFFNNHSRSPVEINKVIDKDLLFLDIFYFQKMQNRTHKIQHIQIDNQALEKKLINDFEVYGYLQQNQAEINNIQIYAKLVNNLSIHRQLRKHKLQQLQNKYQSYQSQTFSIDRSNQQNNTADMIKQTYQRTSKQMEISENLEREIIQTKKSLNLLRGDIGHLVRRNESTKLLFNKVAKVKIVAEDQFKRVALATAKDKQEIKLRNDMQRKFKSRLKNVSNYQHSSLGRIKKNYTEAVLKKQLIYDKLANTHKATQNLQQIITLKNAQEQKDVQNRQSLQHLFNLAKVTNHFSVNNLYDNFKDANDLVNQIIAFHQSQPSIFQDKLDSDSTFVNELCQQILEEYSRLKESIKAQSVHFNELLIIKEQLLQKIAECQNQQTEVIKKFKIQALERYRVHDVMKKNYSQKLQKYQQVLKIYLVLLAYLEKNNCNQSIRQTQKCSKINEDIGSRSSVLQQDQCYYPTYITELHKINQLLASEAHSSQAQYILDKKQDYASSFFAHMLRDVQIWLDKIKQRLNIDYVSALIHKNTLKDYRQSQMYNTARNSKRKDTRQLEEQYTLKQVERQQPSGQTKIHQDEGHTLKSHSKAQKVNSKQLVKAQRIKLLQDIDNDYFRMIKATAKMQKENTRKNYEFTRTFKGTKFSSRDNILEEKRFEASFSVLMTKPTTPHLQRASQKFQSMYSNSNINTATATQNPMNASQMSVATPSRIFHTSFLLQNQRKNRLASKLKYALSFSRLR